MAEINTEIFLAAQKEVERLLAELGKLGSLTEQQNSAKEVLSETGRILSTTGGDLSELVKRLRELSDSISQLEPLSIAEKLNNIESAGTKIHDAIGETRDTLYSGFKASMEQDQEWSKNQLKENSDTIIEALKGLSEALEKKIQKNADSLEKTEENIGILRKIQGTLIVFVISNFLVSIAIIFFYFILRK